MKRAACLLWAGLAATAPLAAAEAPYEFLLAKLAGAEGSWSESLDHFARAVELAPEDPYVRIDYARTLLLVGRRQRAIEEADVARELAPLEADAHAIYARARLATADGDPTAVAEARAAYERLLELRPDDLQALTALGRIHLGSGDADAAASVFRRAIGYRPGSAWLQSMLVDALLRAERAAEAETALEELIRLEPGDARARLTLADLRETRGAFQEAVDVLGNAPAELFADSDYRRRYAFSLYRSGDLDLSLELANGLLEEDPDDFGGLYLKGLVLTAAGHNDEAGDLLRRLLARRPDSLELAILAVRVLERQGAAGEAGELLRTLAERLREAGEDEQAELVDYQRLTVLARSGDWQEVLAVTESQVRPPAAGVSPDLVMLHLDSLTATGRGEEALDLLSRLALPDLSATQRAAKEAELLFEVGDDAKALERLAGLAAQSGLDARLAAAQVYYGAERYAAVIPILEAARVESPDAVQLLFWLGAAYERTGQHDAAERSFRSLLEIDVSFAPALNYLGYMWAELGRNLEEALDLVGRAVLLEPDNGAYVDSLGWAYFRRGDFGRARTLLERAARLVPEDAVIYEHLGDLYLAVGDSREARRQYERALALEGENAEAVIAKLDRLKQEL